MKWLNLYWHKFLNLFPQKCKHPRKYQRSVWVAEYCRKPGQFAYNCRVCGEIHFTKQVLIMKGIKKGDEQ